MFSAMITALVCTRARSPRKLIEGLVIRCLVRRSEAPMRAEPSTKSVARPSNQVIAMVASGWNSPRS